MVDDLSEIQHCDEKLRELAEHERESLRRYLSHCKAEQPQIFEPLSAKRLMAMNELYDNLKFTPTAKKGPEHWQISQNASEIAEKWYQDKKNQTYTETAQIYAIFLPQRSEQDGTSVDSDLTEQEQSTTQGEKESLSSRLSSQWRDGWREYVRLRFRSRHTGEYLRISLFVVYLVVKRICVMSCK